MTDSLDDFPEPVVGDLHSRIPQGEEDRVALAGLPEQLRDQAVAEEIDG